MSIGGSLEIKGVRNGLLVRLNPEDSWKNLVMQLIALIDQQQEFFRGARLALDVGNRSVRRHELGSLQTMLSKRDVTLWAILSKSETTNATALDLGLQVKLGGDTEAAPVGKSDGPVTETLLMVDDEDEPPPIDTEEMGTPGVLVNRTLRSGRTVRSGGHVVVLGDVNPGAQIIAGGDVIIWGRLRGTVHAGAHGDESCVVCALDMTPMQLRIAGHIAMSPDDKRRKPRPEIAMVREDRIMVKGWE